VGSDAGRARDAQAQKPDLALVDGAEGAAGRHGFPGSGQNQTAKSSPLQVNVDS
jgi:hypothetical protein